MTDITREGYAVLGENGLLWAENCGEENRGQFRIYQTEEQARAHKVVETDRIVQAKIVIEEQEQGPILGQE